MKRIVILATVVAFLATLYVASPFLTAWRMREAIKAGDTAYISGKVEWERVRETLKGSIKRHALLVSEVEAHGQAKPPSLWQRVKLALGQPMVDSFVERYVTPEGLPQLYAMKRTYSQDIRGMPDEAALGRVARIQLFASRIKRAEFQSPTVLEIEMADKGNPERHYVSRLEFKNWQWMLTGVEIKPARGAPVDRRSIEAQAGVSAPGVGRLTGPLSQPLPLVQGRLGPAR